jgi:hypothetical protein
MDNEFSRYVFTVVFHEPDLSHLSEEQHNAKLAEHRDAIYAAIERLKALMAQSDWDNPLVPLGIRTTSHPSK